jgi:hypothetical protein
MKQRDLREPDIVAGSSCVAALLDLLGALQDLGEERRQLVAAGIVELDEHAIEMRGRSIEGSVPTGSCRFFEDAAKDLTGDAPTQSGWYLRPLIIVEERRYERLVVVLERPPALLGPAELDASQVAQHPHVVADRGERLIEEATEFDRTALAAFGHQLEEAPPQRVGERLYEAAIERVRRAHKTVHRNNGSTRQVGRAAWRRALLAVSSP